jgi:hypothetical protein
MNAINRGQTRPELASSGYPHGRISFKGRAFDLGKAFRGERVAVRPTVEDGVFGIYFGVHQVAQADLRVQNQPH